jgi:hypothetical protein
MTPETSNASMQPSSVPQTVGSDSTEAAQAVLDLKLQAMRELRTGMELNARRIGILVNEIIDGELWRKAGYRNAEHCLQKKYKEIAGLRNLYGYAAIAKRFTDEDVRRFGTKKLEALLVYERLMDQRVPALNLGQQEIGLKQPDGSEVVKKLKDCSANEVIRGNVRNRKSGRTPESKLATSEHGLLPKVFLAGVGAILLLVAAVLPAGEISGLASLMGASLLIIGLNQLIRRGFNWLLSFIRSGRAIGVLVRMPSRLLALSRTAVRGLNRSWSFIRTGQAIHALAKLPSKLLALSRTIARGLNRLWSFVRTGQIIRALAKLPSNVWSLGRSVAGGVRWLASRVRGRRRIDTLAKVPNRLQSLSLKAANDVHSPAARTEAPLPGELAPPSAR